MPLIKNVGGREPELVGTPEFTEEEKYKLEKRKEAMDKLLQQECIGKYTIEIMFSFRRTNSKTTPGAISIWESGCKLHGGGDGKVYFCPPPDRGGCSAAIPFDNTQYGHNLCPKCGKAWKSTEVVGEILGNWPMEIWAQKLLEYFASLGHNADIYLKQPYGDISS